MVERADKAISTTRQSFDVAGSFRRFSEDVAQPFDRTVQACVKINESISGPEPLAEFIACDDVTRAFQQKDKDAKGLVLKLQADTVFMDFARAQIHGEDIKTDLS